MMMTPPNGDYQWWSSVAQPRPPFLQVRFVSAPKLFEICRNAKGRWFYGE
jgi:hypothetical protein